jgi:hypothetical protein
VEGVGVPERAGTGEWQVLTALPYTSAVLLQGALRAEGIPAELQRDGLAAVYGFDGGGFATRILVPASDAQRARGVLHVLESPA